MNYIPDNYDMWCEYDAELERSLRKLPVCDICGEPIQDAYCYKFKNDIYCECCMTEYFRVDVETLMD